MQGSYDTIADAIVAFTNHFSENWEKVDKVMAIGLEQEKPTFAMPAAVLHDISTHVLGRMLSYGNKAEKVRTQEEQAQLAKYLGKYSPSLTSVKSQGGGRWATCER